ncbi:MAG: YrrC family ATP-dependent DNA helicase, partial [Terriglobia bacterium]
MCPLRSQIEESVSPPRRFAVGWGRRKSVAENLRDRSLLQGTIKRITYQNPDAPYTVARLEVDGVEEVTVVGGIYPVSEGEEIKV